MLLLVGLLYKFVVYDFGWFSWFSFRGFVMILCLHFCFGCVLERGSNLVTVILIFWVVCWIVCIWCVVFGVC